MGQLAGSRAGVVFQECVQCKRGETNLCESYWIVDLQNNGGALETPVASGSTLFLADGAGPVHAVAQPISIAVRTIKRGRADRDNLKRPGFVPGCFRV